MKYTFYARFFVSLLGFELVQSSIVRNYKIFTSHAHFAHEQSERVNSKRRVYAGLTKEFTKEV